VDTAKIFQGVEGFRVKDLTVVNQGVKDLTVGTE